jgi:hypothetical protein
LQWLGKKEISAPLLWDYFYDDAGKNETNDLKSVVLYHHNIIIIKQQSTSHTNQTKPNQTKPNQTKPTHPSLPAQTPKRKEVAYYYYEYETFENCCIPSNHKQ